MRQFRFLLLFIYVLTPLMTSCSTTKRADISLGIQQSYRASSLDSKDPFASVKSSTIILDAGHGGTDEGAKVSAFQEKKIALTTTLLTKKHLEEMGYRVILTRSRDMYVPLPRRVSIANKTQAALFVSLHYNASKNHTAKGIEIFYHDSSEILRTRASRRLASCILPFLIDQTEALSRGVKQGNFYVIRETQMPAVLIEGGFMTNFEERSLLKDKEYLDKIAKGVALGIDKYLKS